MIWIFWYARGQRRRGAGIAHLEVGLPHSKTLCSICFYIRYCSPKFSSRKPWISNNYLPCHCHWPGRPGLVTTPRGWPRNLWASAPATHLSPPIVQTYSFPTSQPQRVRIGNVSAKQVQSTSVKIRTNHKGLRLKLTKCIPFSELFSMALHSTLYLLWLFIVLQEQLRLGSPWQNV